MGVQAAAQATPNGAFRLHDGDTVVFYGDSITEQKLYTSDIEDFVLTRFPDLHIHFVHSGVGGDKVSGGAGGPIDMRLTRDLFAYRPAMITVMLGMNDGYYGPLEPGIRTTYEDGYRHIVELIRAQLPQSTLTLLKPSPYDDVTRTPYFSPGYNATMVQFGDFVGKLAEQNHALVADLNSPVVDALTKAKSKDRPLSTALIRDRVHPGTGIHWLMAEAVLSAWNAPDLVASANIDASRAVAADAKNTVITNLHRTRNSLSWTQRDMALPLPFPAPAADPFLSLVLQVSDLEQRLDQEMLLVSGLAEGSYELQIDDRPVGTFTADQMAKGVNLATLETPMISQARLVAFDTDCKNEIENLRFAFARETRDAQTDDTIARLDTAIQAAIDQQRNDAKPVAHRFALVYMNNAASK